MSNDASQNWVVNFIDVPGRKILCTEGIGQATAPDIRKLTDLLVQKGKSFGGNWAYIPMIEKMSPVFDAETQKEFARMHQECEAAGCIAMAFVAGGMASIKVQAKRHQNDSHAEKVSTEYFRTREEALEWLKTLGL
jgi:hypothetical protein